jgi:hypothetical protein
MSIVRMTLASVSSLEENCLSERKTTRCRHAAEDGRESRALGERFEEQGEMVVL